MIPAGGSKTWSKTAEEAFACLLSRPNRNFMVKLGEELGGSLPVDIMMEEVHEAGALEPMRKEYNIGWCSGGGCTPLEKGKDAGDDKSVTDSSPSSCTTDDTQEETDFMVIHDDQPQFQWRPRSFPKEKQLMVMPSHIDEDAVVYVQILNYEDRETYKVMKEKLKEAYCDRPKPLHRTLRIGQACIARYSLDKLFYRAVILNTGEKGIEVRFIDYGTSEYVSPDGIFTDLMFEDVPVLCLEVEFYGLRPFSTTGGWPLKVLDTVHYMMVEQSCSMVVKTRPTKKSRAKVLLFLPDGVSLYEFMLEAGLACKSVEEPLPDSDEASA
ncbi:hypothetical protein MRX96_005494 [Rhipicephalus microplus]